MRWLASFAILAAIGSGCALAEPAGWEPNPNWFWQPCLLDDATVCGLLTPGQYLNRLAFDGASDIGQWAAGRFDWLRGRRPEAVVPPAPRQFAGNAIGLQLPGGGSPD